jgi:hypothetical protein
MTRNLVQQTIRLLDAVKIEDKFLRLKMMGYLSIDEKGRFVVVLQRIFRALNLPAICERS